jgi:hypothetical protein
MSVFRRGVVQRRPERAGFAFAAPLRGVEPALTVLRPARVLIPPSARQQHNGLPFVAQHRTERAGFEPAVLNKEHTGFRNRLDQPLRHLSGTVPSGDGRDD